MGKKCLKCGYVRRATDVAPEYECPSCGAVYAKVEAAFRNSPTIGTTAAAPRPGPSRGRTPSASSPPEHPFGLRPKGYVVSNLMPGERVVYAARMHWFIFVPGAALFIIGLLFLSTAGTNRNTYPRRDPAATFATLSFIIAAASLIHAYIVRLSTELAVTTKRVIAKAGLISRRTVELNHGKVESFLVNQGILGRIFNFGTIVIQGTGGGTTPIRKIDNPLEFRREAMQIVDKTTGQVPGASS